MTEFFTFVVLPFVIGIPLGMFLAYLAIRSTRR